MRSRRWTNAIVVTLCALLGAAPDAFADSSHVSSVAAGDGAARQQGAPKPHEHAWVKQTRKEWVPPLTEKVQVGTDSKGRPIYETQIVKPGYWKTVTYYVCSCGATRS